MLKGLNVVPLSVKSKSIVATTACNNQRYILLHLAEIGLDIAGE